MDWRRYGANLFSAAMMTLNRLVEYLALGVVVRPFCPGQKIVPIFWPGYFVPLKRLFVVFWSYINPRSTALRVDVRPKQDKKSLRFFFLYGTKSRNDFFSGIKSRYHILYRTKSRNDILTLFVRDKNRNDVLPCFWSYNNPNGEYLVNLGY